MWEVSAHPHLLWAYSGVVGGGTGQVGGAGLPHPDLQGSIPESPQQPSRHKSSG